MVQILREGVHGIKDVEHGLSLLHLHVACYILLLFCNFNHLLLLQVNTCFHKSLLKVTGSHLQILSLPTRSCSCLVKRGEPEVDELRCNCKASLKSKLKSSSLWPAQAI